MGHELHVRSDRLSRMMNQSNLEVIRTIWIHDWENAEMMAVTVLKTESAVYMLWSRNQLTALPSYRDSHASDEDKLQVRSEAPHSLVVVREQVHTYGVTAG